jgi:nitrate reductase beta subunit
MGANAGTPYTAAIGMQGALSYMGVTIVSSNHVASQADMSATGDANYQVDMTAIAGLIWQRAGVASVAKQGLKVDTVDDVRRNTVFTVASMYRGGGVLRPELCATLSTIA